MTYELDSIDEEREYTAPKEHVFDLRPDGSEPGVVGHLNPDEVPIFHRIREEQQLKHGATVVRRRGMAWMMEAAEQARAEARG